MRTSVIYKFKKYYKNIYILILIFNHNLNFDDI